MQFDQDSYVDNTGMRVVIGHYVGGNSGGNLTEGKQLWKHSLIKVHVNTIL